MTQASILAHGPSVPASQGSMRKLNAAWYGLSVRTQVLFVFAMLTVVVSIIAASLKLIDARNRADAEMAAPVALALSLISEVTRNVESETDLRTRLGSVAAELKSLRHVRIEVVQADGGTSTEISKSAFADFVETAETTSPKVPGWFISLIRTDSVSGSLDVISNSGSKLATFIVHGEPADEIYEIWSEFRFLVLLWLASSATLLLSLYFILHHILWPLDELSHGLETLEQGDLTVRVQTARARELSRFVTHFNRLASNLQNVCDENGRLCRNLIAVQEFERKQIASDLHDEIGPCLFGIMVNAQSIEKVVCDVPADVRAGVGSRVKEIETNCDRLKATNRQVLKRLRPAALGKVTLKGLLEDLVNEFQRKQPEVTFATIFSNLERGYGEEIDITIYRCIQEAMTNALRHAAPSSVLVQLLHEGPRMQDDNQTSAANLRLRILDNGSGIKRYSPSGFGLATMRERVRAVEGEFDVGSNWPSGTIVAVKIPLPNAQQFAESAG